MGESESLSLSIKKLTMAAILEQKNRLAHSFGPERPQGQTPSGAAE